MRSPPIGRGFGGGGGVRGGCAPSYSREVPPFILFLRNEIKEWKGKERMSHAASKSNAGFEDPECTFQSIRVGERSNRPHATA